jgi:8-amino-7-oxononanoate synthase
MSSPLSRSSSLQNAMTTHLANRRASSSLRSLTTAPTNSIDFSSNDFLSLSTSPLLKNAFFQELQSNPGLRIGSGGSRLLDGNSKYAEALERDIAAFHNAPAGLLFNSGYDANTGFFATVPQAGDVVLYDEFIHASVHEGMRLSRAEKTLLFKHNSVSSLKSRLDELRNSDIDITEGSRDVFIAVESLYSMDGDLAPLVEIVEAVESLLPLGNGHVIVDEAHSTGVFGEKGRGVVCSLGLEKRVFAKLHTFGKAIGCNGGGDNPSL